MSIWSELFYDATKIGNFASQHQIGDGNQNKKEFCKDQKSRKNRALRKKKRKRLSASIQQIDWPSPRLDLSHSHALNNRSIVTTKVCLLTPSFFFFLCVTVHRFDDYNVDAVSYLNRIQ